VLYGPGGTVITSDNAPHAGSRFRAALAVGVTLSLPWIATSAGSASAHGRSPSVRGLAASTRQAAPTTMSISIGPAAAVQASDSPAANEPAPPAVPPICRNINLEPTASNLRLVETAALCLVNKVRVADGLVALAEDGDLDRAATAHSVQMASDDYFNHVSPTGATPAQRVLGSGFVPLSSEDPIAENIFAATLPNATAAEVVSSWMRSAPHRANILNANFRVTGIGLTSAVPAMLGRHSGGTYTEDFA
jgi:uncharacterized protein YkwD